MATQPTTRGRFREIAIRHSSTPSRSGWWVELLEFDACIAGGKSIGPGSHCLLRKTLVRDALVETLLGQGGQFDLGHVQPSTGAYGLVCGSVPCLTQ